MAPSARTALLFLPFAILFWVQWLRSIPSGSDRAAHETTDPAALALLSARRSATLNSRGGAVLAVGAATAAQPDAAAVTTAAASSGGCPASRKPYHVVLTATAQVYQQWQCRIMYHQWKAIRDADPAGACTEMTGFTRLVASAGGKPDGLEGEIPSVFTPEWDGRDVSRFKGYRVINRPRSVVQFLKTAAYAAIKEEYMFIAETDHILLQPIPNLATLGSPMAYVFGYMGPNPSHAKFLHRAWPAGGADGYKRVQSIGPSVYFVFCKQTRSDRPGNLGWTTAKPLTVSLPTAGCLQVRRPCSSTVRTSSASPSPGRRLRCSSRQTPTPTRCSAG